jgi:hypothetical protein
MSWWVGVLVGEGSFRGALQMIVQPDFPDHWKTEILVARVGEKGVRALLRLWGYCQTAKCSWVPQDAMILAAICKFDGDKEALRDALLESGFLVRGRGRLKHFSVHDFALVNSALFASWRNGKKGGRPRVEENEGRETNGKVLGKKKIHNKTQRKPRGNPRVTSGITQEKTQEEPTGYDRIVIEEDPPVVPQGGTVHGDESHRVLKGSGMLGGLTYEMDLKARQFWPMDGEEVLRCAEAAARDASLWANPPEQPGLWWRKRLEKWHGDLVKKKSVPRGGSRDFVRMTREVEVEVAHV